MGETLWNSGQDFPEGTARLLEAIRAGRSASGATTLLCVRLLGGCRVDCSEVRRSPAWPRRSAKTLTKLLASHPEHALHRECDLLTRRGETHLAMIAVSGEAGVGKTRLLEEFGIRAREQGAVTLWGGRSARANLLPLWTDYPGGGKK
jgi:hypothetical protein